MEIPKEGRTVTLRSYCRIAAGAAWWLVFGILWWSQSAFAQQLKPSQWNAGGTLSVARSAPGDSNIGGVIPSGPKQGFFAVIGGVDASSNPTANVDLIDALGNVTAGPSLHVPVFGHSVATDNHAVYVSGGITTGATITGSLEILNTSTLSWSSGSLVEAAACPGCPTGLIPFYHQMVVPQGTEPVIVGGDTASGFSPFIQEPNGPYDLTTAALPRVNHTVTVLPDGRVVIIGGSDVDGNPLGTIEIYSPVAVFGDVPQYSGGNLVSIGGGLVSGPSLLTPRAFHTATLLPDGTILVAGGIDASHLPIASTEIVNIAAGTCTPGPPLQVARVYHIAVPLNSQTNGGVLFIGGMTNGPSGPVPTGSVEVYEPWLGAMRLLGQSMATPRSQFAAANLGANSIVVAGGLAKNFSPLASTEVYPYPTLISSDIYLDQSFTLHGAGWPAGAAISIVAHSPNGLGYSTTLIANAAADGTFTLSFTPPAGFAEFYFTSNAGPGIDDVNVGPFGVHGCTQDGATCDVFTSGDTFVNGKPGYGTLRDVLSLAAVGTRIPLASLVTLCSPLVLSHAMTLQGAPTVVQGCAQSGGGTAQTRFFIITGTGVVLADITLNHGFAQGVSAVGPNLQAGPGGGAGLGGAIVVSGGSATLNRVTFYYDQAQGGIGGNGTTADNPALAIGSNGTPDSAVVPYLPSGFGDGGGAGSLSTYNNTIYPPGAGSYGGGGGGGGFEDGSYGNGGQYGGNGAGGGTHHGGLFGNDNDYGGGGGGGAGLGGALYVQSGKVVIDSCTFTGNTAVGGAGGLTNYNYPNGSSGQGAGNAIFVYSGTVSLANEASQLSLCGQGPQDVCPGPAAPLPVTITLTSAPAQVTAATLISLTAALSIPAGPIVPNFDGPVDFYDGGTFLGSAIAVAGIANLHSLRLPAGLHNLKAVYKGTVFLQASTSKIAPLSVAPVPSLLPNAYTSFLTGPQPKGMVTGDFNGDGILDLAVSVSAGSNPSPGEIVHLGIGDGTFQPGIPLTAYGSIGSGIAVSDFGFRGAASIAADSGAGLEIFQGDGHGGFPSTAFPWNAFQVNLLVTADFNRDGYPDVAASEGFPSPIYVFLASPTGQYSSGTALANSTHYTSLATADLNGDGIPDLIAGSYAAATSHVSVFLGNGDGTFKNPVDYPVAGSNGSVTAVAVGDFDGNGIPDVAAISNTAISILLGNGNGSLQAAIPFALAHAESNLTVGDLNGDGMDDLVTSDSGGVNIFYSTGKGQLSLYGPYPMSDPVNALAVGDYDGYGVPEIAIALNGGTVDILKRVYSVCDIARQGQVTVTDAQTIVNEALGKLTASDDLNHDGRVDVADVQIVTLAVMGKPCLPN